MLLRYAQLLQFMECVMREVAREAGSLQGQSIGNNYFAAGRNAGIQQDISIATCQTLRRQMGLVTIDFWLPNNHRLLSATAADDVTKHTYSLTFLTAACEFSGAS